jgi:hypothetical protein
MDPKGVLDLSLKASAFYAHGSRLASRWRGETCQRVQRLSPRVVHAVLHKARLPCQKEAFPAHDLSHRAAPAKATGRTAARRGPRFSEALRLRCYAQHSNAAGGLNLAPFQVSAAVDRHGAMRERRIGRLRKTGVTLSWDCGLSAKRADFLLSVGPNTVYARVASAWLGKPLRCSRVRSALFRAKLAL